MSNEENTAKLKNDTLHHTLHHRIQAAQSTEKNNASKERRSGTVSRIPYEPPAGSGAITVAAASGRRERAGDHHCLRRVGCGKADGTLRRRPEAAFDFS